MPTRNEELKKFLQGQVEFARTVGKATFNTLKKTPSFLKEDIPLMFNPIRLHELYRATGPDPELIKEKNFKKVAVVMSATPVLAVVTAVVLAVVAPAYVLGWCGILSGPFIMAFVANHDCLEGQKHMDTATNAEGKNVSGPGLSLYRLSRAQDKITKLTAPFNAGAAIPKKVERKVQKIVASVEKDRKVVKAADGADYQFTGASS